MKRVAALTLCVAALAVVGCGSSDSSTTTANKAPKDGGLAGCAGGKAIIVSLPKGDVTKPNTTKKVSDPSIDLILASARVSDSNKLCMSMATQADIEKGTEFVIGVLSSGKLKNFNITTATSGEVPVTSSGKKVSGATASSQGKFVTSVIPGLGITPDSKFGFRIGALDGNKAADVYPQGDNYISFPEGKTLPSSSFNK